VLALGCASFPWRLEPERVAGRLDVFVAPYGYHWERPAVATLRLFPEPILDVFPLALDDAAGRPVFTAATGAARLSFWDLLFGRFTPLRARLKDASGDVDLDALAQALPALVDSPPVAALQTRGGELRVRSARFGIDEKVAPFNASWTWNGPDAPLHATLSGPLRGLKTDIEATVDAPAEFLAGRASAMRLEVTTEGAAATLDGDASIGAEPSFNGKISAKADSLARAAEWAVLDIPGLPDKPGGVSGLASAAPGVLNFEDGALMYGGQTFEGAAGLQKGAHGWNATATLAAERLDLALLLGPPPQLREADGAWSGAPILLPLPAFDLDLRISAASAAWGETLISDAAVAVTRRGGETALKILEAGFSGGVVKGDLILKGCAERCALRATLSLVNADAERLTGTLGRRVATGVCAVDLDVAAYGDSPAALVASSEGELGVTVRDGAILGVNFEEALRRSQRRPIEFARDLLVGETAFRKLEARLDLADGAARMREARLTGPGVSVTGEGTIDFGAQALDLSVQARQADALGHVSAGGAALGLTATGPWRSLTIELPPSPN
jgi:AsmA protein